MFMAHARVGGGARTTAALAVASACALLVACDGRSGPPTAPIVTQAVTTTVPIPVPANRAPEVTGIDVSPDGVALVGATAMSFSAHATDPDGDALTYDWNFGDGRSAANVGPSTQHVFADAGRLAIAVTVTDARGASTAFYQPINAVTVTGTWRGCALSGTGPQTYEIGQNGTAVSGTYKVPTLQVPFSGTVLNQRIVLINIFDDQRQPWVLDPTGMTLVWTSYCALARQ